MAFGRPTGFEEPSARGLVLLTVQRDGDLATSWLEALDAEGIEAELHLRDAASFSPTSSVYPTGAPLVHALFVSGRDRDRAAALLIDLGWDGRGMSSGPRAAWNPLASLPGAVIALLVATFVVAALLAARAA